jgi:hypothetical protein
MVVHYDRMIVDWLFRFKIKKGTRAKAPDNLVDIIFLYKESDGSIIFKNLEKQISEDLGKIVSNCINYYYFLNKIHPMHEWLLHCEGPWRITVDKIEKQIYIAFARKTDAAMFRIMSA